MPEVKIDEELAVEKGVVKSELKRGLKRRHMNMIAIGGAIGTGLFVASGATISTAGPGGALTAYALIGIMVYFLMTGLGEMATEIPLSGSFANYATRFCDPALGFALGWNYWYNWAITVACELAAAALVMKYWYPNVPATVWSIVFLAILFAINIFSARGYGEAEFWFAGIKVVAVVCFLLIGIALLAGMFGYQSPGMRNWHIGQAPFVGGLMGTLMVFMIAGFSFQGTELVGVAAGESENPEKDIPRAINSVFWRILLFYIGAIFIIGTLVPYTDPNLLKSGVENISISPFTLVFKHAGFRAAADIMNFVILTAVLSCGNSGMYASSRMLYAMAEEGKAPKFFLKLNRRGVPINCLYFTTLIAMVSFLSSLWGEGTVYTWLVNASGLAGFIAWCGIAYSHYHFRKAYVLQGRDLNKLRYRAKWYPFGPIFALVLCLLVIIGQNLGAWLTGDYSIKSLLVAYIGIPLFVVLWAGYKIVKKTKFIDPMEASFDFFDEGIKKN